MHERHKLTREYLMSLTEGLYLVSNPMYNSMQPFFAEKVAPLNLRKDQWERIKNVAADQRLCNVFESEPEHIKQRAEFNDREEVHNLTRKYLMSLTEGLYLVSSRFHISKQSCFADFAEKVAPLKFREGQWDRIKKANADQRYCNVYKSKKECTRWVIQYNKNINEIKKQSMI